MTTVDTLNSNLDTETAPALPEAPETEPAVKPKAKRGFAAMSPEKVKAIAAKGGKAAHLKGTAHQFSSEEASSAGKKGGLAPHKARGRHVQKSEAPSAETIDNHTDSGRLN